MNCILERGDPYTHKAMQEARIGMWKLERPDHAPACMRGDDALLEILGVNADYTAEEVYEIFYRNVHPDDMEIVRDLYKKIQSGQYGEAQFRWRHNEDGNIFLRCGAIINDQYEGGECIEGILQNVTEIRRIRNRVYRSQKIADMFMTPYKDIIYVNLTTGIGETYSSGTKLGQEEVRKPFFNAIQNYILTSVAPEDQFAMQMSVNPSVIRERLKKAERFVTDFLEVGNGRPQHMQMIVVRGENENYIGVACVNVDKEYRMARIQESVLDVMSNFFDVLIYVETATDEIFVSKLTNKVKDLVSGSEASISYSECIKFLLSNLVSPEEKSRLQGLLAKSAVVERLAVRKHYTIDFKVLIRREEVPYQINLTRDPNRDGVEGFIIGFMRLKDRN